MSSIRQKVIVASLAILGLKSYDMYTAPANHIEDNHTGTVALACEGEQYQLDGSEIVEKTRQKVSPVSLKLDFQNGQIMSWTAAHATVRPAEDTVAVSQLVHQFETTCGQRASRCTPVSNDKGDTELYAFKYRSGDMSLGGLGLLSKDISNFAGYFQINGVSYANAMSCKIA